MEIIYFLILIILAIILFKIIFKINIKKMKEKKENKELEEITDKFPQNVEVAKTMLEMLDNNSVKIEEAKNTETSLYIAVTNKISIADMKKNYARIQTIAHECIHSYQDRRLLLFNFIFSNINIIYFIIISILTILKVISNQNLQIEILMLFTLIEFSVRSFLEIDAMTKAKYLAKEYMEKIKLCTEEGKNKLLKEYGDINKIGIPFVIDNLLTTALIRVLIYCIISIIW